MPTDPPPQDDQRFTSFGAALDGSRLPLSPSQTVGPFLSIALDWADGSQVVPPGTPGAVRIGGRLLDGAGDPVPDGVIETWQADPHGGFNHPDDPRDPVGTTVPGFRGFGRCATRPDGSWDILTVKPGGLPAPDGAREAPHLDVSVLARGLLARVVTRIYFPDDASALEQDPVLEAVDPKRRETLVARRQEAGPDGTPSYRFDIRLQGADETVFFDL